jgi:hypothetical protein
VHSVLETLGTLYGTLSAIENYIKATYTECLVPSVTLRKVCTECFFCLYQVFCALGRLTHSGRCYHDAYSSKKHDKSTTMLPSMLDVIGRFEMWKGHGCYTPKF